MRDPSTDTVRVVTGRVVDATTGKGLSGAVVVIDGTTAGARVNPDGRFRIVLSGRFWIGRPLRLTASHDGYASVGVPGIVDTSVLFRLHPPTLRDFEAAALQ